MKFTFRNFDRSPARITSTTSEDALREKIEREYADQADARNRQVKSLYDDKERMGEIKDEYFANFILHLIDNVPHRVFIDGIDSSGHPDDTKAVCVDLIRRAYWTVPTSSED